MQHLGLTLLPGQVGQPVWSHLATQVPDQAIPYNGIAAVAGQDYDLGTGAQVENHTFEVIAPLAYTVGPDPMPTRPSSPPTCCAMPATAPCSSPTAWPACRTGAPTAAPPAC